jgi:predicted nucleic acid-binding Zn ribbon protein
VKTVGAALQELIRDLGISKPIQRHAALAIWPEVVGETISNVTEPEYISGDRLIVKVRNHAWRNELVYQKAAILSKLNRTLKETVISDIVFI